MTNARIRARLEAAAEDSRRTLVQFKPRFLHDIRDERIRRFGMKMLKEWSALIQRLHLPEGEERTNPKKRRQLKLTKREVVTAAANFVASTATPRISARELLAEHAKSQGSDFDALDKIMSQPGAAVVLPSPVETTEPAKQDNVEEDTAKSTVEDRSDVPNNEQTKNGVKSENEQH